MDTQGEGDHHREDDDEEVEAEPRPAATFGEDNGEDSDRERQIGLSGGASSSGTDAVEMTGHNPMYPEGHAAEATIEDDQIKVGINESAARPGDIPDTKNPLRVRKDEGRTGSGTDEERSSTPRRPTWKDHLHDCYIVTLKDLNCSRTDVEGLLATLALLSTLLLSFAVGALNQFSHDDMIAADQRELEYQFYTRCDEDWNNLGAIDGCDESEMSLSRKYFRSISNSMLLLLLALFVGVLTYMVFLLSAVNDSDKEYGKVAAVYGFIIACGYLLLLIGAFLFQFSCLIAAEMMYPRYRQLGYGNGSIASENAAELETFDYEKYSLPEDLIYNDRGVIQNIATENMVKTTGTVIGLLVGAVFLFYASRLRKKVTQCFRDSRCCPAGEEMATTGSDQAENERLSDGTDEENAAAVTEALNAVSPELGKYAHDFSTQKVTPALLGYLAADIELCMKLGMKAGHALLLKKGHDEGLMSRYLSAGS